MEGDDRGDGLGEGLDRPTVVGVHDSPGFEVRDGLLDDVADPVDPGFEFLFPAEQFTACGLLDGGEHAVANVPLVAHPAAGIERQQDSGFIKTVSYVVRRTYRL